MYAQKYMDALIHIFCPFFRIWANSDFSFKENHNTSSYSDSVD